MAETTQTSDSLLGRLVVEQGLAGPEEVQECLDLRNKLVADPHAEQRSLGNLLVAQGIVTQRQLDRVHPTTDGENKPTQQVPGFMIIERLGAGAMATVYLARQLSLDRMVAIKFLPKKHTNNPEFVQRFYAEGRAAAKLNHPNIVGALDVGQAADRHYFVMEYVEGRTVFDDINENKKYSEPEALDVIIQIARALAHAHHAGFIHRDVKPKNMMVTQEGVVKLADMGLARAVSDREMAESEQGKAYGTPYYISPEQIRGTLDVDFRADIYSLGASLYHMVTGQIPFDGPNPSAVMHQHLKAKLTPPDHLNASLSAGIGEIIEVCMAKVRDQRYNNTSDLLDDLETVRNGEAPMQARKKFDLASLTALEHTGEAPGPGIAAEADQWAAQSGSTQPLYWIAAAGWATAAILLVALILLIITNN